MKRRWKVGIVLAVVGITVFLVWAFLSPATPPLSAGFRGYVTNDEARVIGNVSLPRGSIMALFVVSSNTGRVMAAHANAAMQVNGVETLLVANWIRSPHDEIFRIWGYPHLAPGEAAWYEANVPRTDVPVCVFVAARHVRPATTDLGRFWNRMPWNKRTFSASATNEWR